MYFQSIRDKICEERMKEEVYMLRRVEMKREGGDTSFIYRPRSCLRISHREQKAGRPLLTHLVFRLGSQETNEHRPKKKKSIQPKVKEETKRKHSLAAWGQNQKPNRQRLHVGAFLKFLQRRGSKKVFRFQLGTWKDRGICMRGDLSCVFWKGIPSMYIINDDSKHVSWYR